MLDLPCGFGRVTRFLCARYPAASITVSDLDRDGVDYCAARFNAQAAYSVRDFRDLQLGGAYDLLWVGSLITHLPAPRRFAGDGGAPVPQAGFLGFDTNARR